MVGGGGGGGGGGGERIKKITKQLISNYHF